MLDAGINQQRSGSVPNLHLRLCRPFVWNLVAGAKNKTEQMKAIRLAAKFQMIYFTQVDLDWAMQQQIIYTLSHNVGMNDCLIACIAYRLQLPLYTTNLKHFVPLLGSLAQKPY
jgi:predicted nucleic acid-binding protein